MHKEERQDEGERLMRVKEPNTTHLQSKVSKGGSSHHHYHQERVSTSFHQTSPYVTMVLRIRAVCTPIPQEFSDDHWFFCDMLLLQQLVPRAADEMWLVPLNLTQHHYQRYLEANGHPQVERVLLKTSESPPLFRQIPDSNLKAAFLGEINGVFSAADDGDQILLIVNGHGSDENNSYGGVEIDVGGATPSYLMPTDVLRLIPVEKNLNITIIINSCFSGKWIEVATAMGISERIILVTRCDTDSEILAFPEDATRRTCGGYFANFLVNEFYREYGYHFPRPAILQGITQDGTEIYDSCFPNTNLTHISTLASPPQRILQRTFADLITSLTSDLRLLSSILPTPQITLSNTIQPSYRAIGVLEGQNTPLRLTETIPPDPAPHPIQRTGRRFNTNQHVSILTIPGGVSYSCILHFLT